MLLIIPLTIALSTDASLSGAWSGEASHAGKRTGYALEIAEAGDTKLAVAVSIPAIHVLHQPLGEFEAKVDGARYELGWLGTLTLSADGGTLSGVVPDVFAPVYELPFTLKRVETLEFPARAPLDAPLAKPLWIRDVASAAWPGATFADGLVLVGVEAGRLLALDATTGEPRWEFATGTRLRSRATVAADTAFLHSDDGQVYALELATGKERWRQRLETEPIVRLPFDDPRSRFDRFGSAVALAGERAYVGTHDGRVLCLDAATGKVEWSHTGGDCVLAAPAVDSVRVCYGGFDGRVRALDVRDGEELWSFDTHKPVVSTPALVGARAIVGSRSYDLYGFDARTGDVAWQHYVWFSWIESNPRVADGVVYVGSSDAALLAAYDAESGKPLWSTDVHGWAWGEPALGATRAYVGTCGQGGYLAPHLGGVVAVERKTGRPTWRFAAETTAATYGFPGSPAVGGGRVFATGLDGRVYAFAE